MKEIAIEPKFAAWREVARTLLAEETPPQDISWRVGKDAQASFFEPGFFESSSQAPAHLPGAQIAPPPTDVPPANPPRVPAEFLQEAKWVAAHRDPKAFSLLYRILWRLTHGEPELLHISIDPDIAQFRSFGRQVHRDAHKAKAFVRFRSMRDDDGIERMVAWHEPDHRVIALVADFFAERFAGMRWSILTPEESAHWDGTDLQLGEGCAKELAPTEDSREDLWRTYYASIFNPARIKIGAMKKEMAPRYWKNMPETRLIPDLLRDAPNRLAKFYENQRPGAEKWVQAAGLVGSRTLESLRSAARNCQACGICHRATQTVFGEGSGGASIALVGEQPGDQEDLEGRPFIGPAGNVLDEALLRADLPREQLYLTNAVKHFKWREQGPRRLHDRPAPAEIAACRPWLAEELSLVRPKVLVCLGASAAQSVLGKTIRLMDVQGKWLESALAPRVRVTYHPSAYLRATDEGERARIFAAIVEDLRQARSAAA